MTNSALITVETGTDELLCTIDRRAAVITLNRPAASNALSDRLTPALRRMIAYCTDKKVVRAVLITGTGDTFSAGGDVKGMGDRGDAEADRLADEAFTIALRLADGPAIAYSAIKDNLGEAQQLGFYTSLDKEAGRLVRTAQTEEHREPSGRSSRNAFLYFRDSDAR